MAGTLTYLAATYWPFLAAAFGLGVIAGFAAAGRIEDHGDNA
jgi:hypothetical protein